MGDNLAAAIVSTAFILCVTLVVVLTLGSPDLLDAIIKLVLRYAEHS